MLSAAEGQIELVSYGELNSATVSGFHTALQGGNPSLEHFPRASPRAIFVFSLREKLR
jgi:hypothetical protein